MNKLLKTLATPFRAVGNMLNERRRTRKTRTRVAPGLRNLEIDKHRRTVAGLKRVERLGPVKHRGRTKRGKAEKKARRKAFRGYGSKKRTSRRGRKTRRRGKRRTKSKK